MKNVSRRLATRSSAQKFNAARFNFSLELSQLPDHNPENSEFQNRKSDSADWDYMATTPGQIDQE